VERYLVRNGDGDAVYEVERGSNSELRVRRGESGEWETAELERVGDSGLFLLLLNHRPHELYIERRGRLARVTIGRHNFEYEVERWSPLRVSRRRATKPTQRGVVEVTAPMTGSIVDVFVSPGETVAAGAVLLLIESMKMNNEIRAPASGEILEVAVAAGARVQAGTVLVRLHVREEPAEED